MSSSVHVYDSCLWTYSGWKHNDCKLAYMYVNEWYRSITHRYGTHLYYVILLKVTFRCNQFLLCFFFFFIISCNYSNFFLFFIFLLKDRNHTSYIAFLDNDKKNPQLTGFHYYSPSSSINPVMAFSFPPQKHQEQVIAKHEELVILFKYLLKK